MKTQLSAYHANLMVDYNLSRDQRSETQAHPRPWPHVVEQSPEGQSHPGSVLHKTLNLWSPEPPHHTHRAKSVLTGTESSLVPLYPEHFLCILKEP